MKPPAADVRSIQGLLFSRLGRAVFSRTGLAAAAAASLVASLSKDALAEQFILIDATFDYTWDDAMKASPSKSHFYVNEGNFLNKSRPVNWLTPIDYRNGTLHVRTEVFKKPAGTQQVGWTLCYIPNAGGYGCADTTYYTSTGVFDRETAMTAWWNNAMLQWDRGIKQVDLIYAINDSGSGHITNYPALKDLTTPTRVRITMVQVSAGAKYDPSIIPALGDAGSPVGTGDGGGNALDAGNLLDALGVGGSGGSGGAGGTSMTGGMGGLMGTGGSGGTMTSGGGSAGTMTSGSGSAGTMTSGSGSSGTMTSGSGTGTGTSGSGGTLGVGGSSGGSSSTTTSNPGASDNENGCAITPRRRERPPGALAGWFALGALALARRRWRRRAA